MFKSINANKIEAGQAVVARIWMGAGNYVMQDVVAKSVGTDKLKNSTEGFAFEGLDVFGREGALYTNVGDVARRVTFMISEAEAAKAELAREAEKAAAKLERELARQEKAAARAAEKEAAKAAAKLAKEAQAAAAQEAEPVAEEPVAEVVAEAPAKTKRVLTPEQKARKNELARERRAQARDGKI